MRSAFMRILIPACIAALLGSALIAVAAPAVTVTPNVTFRIAIDHTGSAVNWLDGQLEVVSQGFALQKGDATQARATAFTILIDESRRGIAKIKVDGATTLATVLTDPESKAIVENMVARLVVAYESWDEKTGAYTIVGVIPLYGQHGLSYLGARAMSSFKPIDFTGKMITITMPIPRGWTTQQFEKPYSGIIVDGDQAMLTPCLFPRILRFDGKELWGPFTLSPAEVISGPTRYAANLEAAIQQKAAGDHPLIVSAVGNGLGSNPVLNLDDVYLILLQQKEVSILNKLPIVITLGQKDAAK